MSKLVRWKGNKERYKKRVKDTVMEHYGGAKCAKCGFSDIRALCIDHINGDGWKDRRWVNGRRGEGRGTSQSLYVKLINLGFPPGYQVLCANCNLIKAFENREFHRREEA